MGKEGFARVAFAAIFATGLSACVTLPPNSPRSPQDPWESWNRGVYKFNDFADRAVAKPVARAYVKVVPQPIRTGAAVWRDTQRSCRAVHGYLHRGESRVHRVRHRLRRFRRRNHEVLHAAQL